ncbi:hypothetical protein AB0A74_35805 [Saccharothrix sp. NPDC042600]|uniref:hypothetical protein n=1 Tax=Saccharothrix TaxID=2071 RepID=UPI0033EB9512|nr:hypothetical protein GCM10017745_43360 [Saccharothrix mutabilis subsp. capreolus]
MTRLVLPVLGVALLLSACGSPAPAAQGPASDPASTTATTAVTTTPTTPTSRPPQFSEAGWFATHPLKIEDSILESSLRAGAIVVTGRTESDWGNRKYTGGLNEGWFVAYRKDAVSAGRVRAPASMCTMPVQGHENYCVGGSAAYGVSLGASPPLDEGIYQPTRVMLFDQNTSEIDQSTDAVPAGQKFRVVLNSRMFSYDPETFRSGDLAVLWLDSTKRDSRIDGFKAMPSDAFIPVTS